MDQQSTTAAPILSEGRMAEVLSRPLKAGDHDSIDEGHCVMEAVAYVAGEQWSDHPACACPVITAFMVSWNDNLSTDADRGRLLKPLVPLIVGTRSTPAVERRRAMMAADWLIRVHAPAWLRCAKLDAQAVTLESLPEIVDFAQCPSLLPRLETVRKDASDTGADGWAAAADALWAAAADAVWAAGKAAAAAGDALAPTVAWLQDSAADLVRRMCEVRP